MNDFTFVQQAIKFAKKEILLGQDKNDLVTDHLIKNLEQDKDKLQNSTYAQKMIDGGVSNINAILKALYCCYHQCGYAGDAIIALNKYGEDGVLDRLSAHCSSLHVDFYEELRVWTDTYITQCNSSDIKLTVMGSRYLIPGSQTMFVSSKAIYFRYWENKFIRIDTEGNAKEVITTYNKLAEQCLMLGIVVEET